MPTILEIIESRLIPDEQAKKARGEVFTPLNLVRELLYGVRKSDLDAGDLLPWGVDKDGNVAADDDDDRIGGIPLEMWRDPDTKWLDPANGIGNFPFIAFHMLDYQLKHHGTKGSKEWNDETRRKHIIGNMLYMVEIDRGNVNTSVKIFRQLIPGLTANVYCGDALTIEKKKPFKDVDKFDVVMGNPPFNTSRVSHATKNTPKGTLWDKFITLSLSLLKDDGMLAFITPALWRQPNSIGGLWSVMTKASQMEYVRIISKQSAMKIFDVSQRVDMYLLRKTPQSKVTSVIDEKGALRELNLSEWPFLPNYAYDYIKPILVPKADGIKVIYSTVYHTSSHKNYVKQEKTDVYKYPIVNTINRHGLGLLYTDTTERGHFGIPKVLLNKNENQYPVNDHEGQYGMTELTFGLPTASKEDGDQMVEAINSDKFKEIIKATKWGAFQTDYHMFEYFRPDFYKEFLKKADEGGVRHVTPRKQRTTRTTRRKRL